MVKLCAGPWHPFANGATEMIAITGALVVFNAVKDGIFPVPLPAKPMEGLLLLQVKLVPLTAPVKFIALVAAPLHTVWLAGTAILGVGLTVIVKLWAAPGQPFASGVTVIVAVTATLDTLVAKKDGISPVPLAAKPMVVLSFVQPKLVPLTEPVKFTVPVAALLHKTWLAGCTTLGVGFTVIVKLCEGPGQPLARGVTVIVAITGALVEFVAVNDGIFPLPLAAKPIEVLLFVQLNPVPLTAPEKFIALVVALLHKDWLAGCTTLGVGLTAIVKLCKVPGHP